MGIVNSIVVSFGETVTSDSGSITVEWDDSLNVDDDGEVKTSFVPGDTLSLLVHHGDDVKLVGVKSTSGTLSGGASVSLTRKEELCWCSDDDEQSLSYSPSGGLSYTWYGRVGSGAVRDDKTVTMSDSFPCLALVSYPATFLRYLLQTPTLTLAEDETWPLQVVVYYEELES
jgi:hypothetical protein